MVGGCFNKFIYTDNTTQRWYSTNTRYKQSNSNKKVISTKDSTNTTSPW